MQAHLDGCESCRREMTLCRSAEGALLSASAQIPSAGDLRTGFYGRLATQQRRPRRYGRPLALSALAAGVVALALVRPALQTHVVPPAGPEGVSVNLPPNASRPTISHSSPPILPEEKPARLPELAGLPNYDVKPSFGFVRSKFTATRRHWSKSNRFTPRPDQARLVRRLSLNRTLLVYADVHALDKTYRYVRFLSALPPEKKPDVETLASAGVSARVDKLEELPGLEANDRSIKAGLQQIAFAPSGEAGVSLEVTDQVRGFSNTTRVASDVEVLDGSSTIHVEADGN